MIKKNIIKNNLVSHGSRSLKGIITPPGDKSISHRALLFSSLALGKSEISNLLHSEDVLNMVKALKLLGIKITKINNVFYVIGSGLTGFNIPNKHIMPAAIGLAMKVNDFLENPQKTLKSILFIIT